MSYSFEYGAWLPETQDHIAAMSADVTSRIDAAELRKVFAANEKRKISRKVVEAIIASLAKNKIELFAMLGNSLSVEKDISWIEDEQACKTRFDNEIIAKFPMHALSLSAFSGDEIAQNTIKNRKISDMLACEGRVPHKVTSAIAFVCNCKELNAALRKFYSGDGVTHGKVGITIDPMLVKHVTYGDLTGSAFITSPYTLCGYLKDQFGNIIAVALIVIDKHHPRAVFAHVESNAPVDHQRAIRSLLEARMADHFGIDNAWIKRTGVTNVRIGSSVLFGGTEIISKNAYDPYATRLPVNLSYKNALTCPVCGCEITPDRLACESCMNEQ